MPTPTLITFAFVKLTLAANHHTNDIDLNDIPHDACKFPDERISEVSFDTQGLMNAFLDGLHYADDIDVVNSEVFMREGEYICISFLIIYHCRKFLDMELKVSATVDRDVR